MPICQAVACGGQADLEQADVIALIEGTTLDVKCSVPGCRCARTWWMGEDALERLIERRRS